LPRNIAKISAWAIKPTLDSGLYCHPWNSENPFVPGAKSGQDLKMKSLLLRFCKEESGATAIEYGLIAAGIAIAIITAVKGVGSQLSTNFDSISTSLK
jgi:pilus assembly protein Flp/PilA